MTRPVIRAALGRSEHRAALRAHHAGSALFDIELVEVTPISRAFAPMVRDSAFDLSEMALASALQARAYDRPIVLLPVILVSRHQAGALLCRADDGLSPDGLAGRRIGVRAYTQTTGLWVRGILADEHGLQASDLRWITFEDAHVAEYDDPPWVERAVQGADMLEMLRAGALDAVIVGADVPVAQWLRPVFPDPAATATRFSGKHGFVPVNHIAAVTGALAQAHPDWLPELMRLLGGGTRAAVQPSVDLALRYMAEQALLPRTLRPDEVWAGLPDSIA